MTVPRYRVTSLNLVHYGWEVDMLINYANDHWPMMLPSPTVVVAGNMSIAIVMQLGTAERPNKQIDIPY